MGLVFVSVPRKLMLIDVRLRENKIYNKTFSFRSTVHGFPFINFHKSAEQNHISGVLHALHLKLIKISVIYLITIYTDK